MIEKPNPVSGRRDSLEPQNTSDVSKGAESLSLHVVRSDFELFVIKQ